MNTATPSTEKAFNDTYSYSFDGENYQGSFDSREHAAEEAFAEDDTAQSVWTGRSIVPDRTLSAADVIEQVACSTTEESGDWSDGYLTGVPPKALQELEAELQALWDRWEAKYGLEPNWFNIEDCKEHFRSPESVIDPDASCEDDPQPYAGVYEADTEEIASETAKIHALSQIELARLWRFSPSGHPWFDSTLPYHDIFVARFKELGGMTPEISKAIPGKP